jgi:signal transduction histidine kinase
VPAAPAPEPDPVEAERERRAGLVHDLRTPLTLVSGFADLLVRRDDLTPEQRADFLARIAEAAAEMMRLLDADREERRS